VDSFSAPELAEKVEMVMRGVDRVPGATLDAALSLSGRLRKL
jgi:hypothetical protein